MEVLLHRSASEEDASSKRANGGESEDVSGREELMRSRQTGSTGLRQREISLLRIEEERCQREEGVHDGGGDDDGRGASVREDEDGNESRKREVERKVQFLRRSRILRTGPFQRDDSPRSLTP
jgi:hypothetical protein